MIKKYGQKELETIPLDELDKRYWELYKLKKSVNKSRPHLDPTFCTNCLKSCLRDPKAPFPVSECCQSEMTDKIEMDKIIEVQSNIASTRLAAHSRPLRKKRSRSRSKRQRGTSGSFKISKARKRVSDPAQEVTVILNGVSFTFPTRKRLRKFLRERGTSITQFDENEEGILVQEED